MNRKPFKITFNPKERIYNATNGACFMVISKKGNVALIDFVWSHERGKGHASALLYDVFEEAKRRKWKLESTHPINPAWEKLCKAYGLTVRYVPSNEKQQRFLYKCSLLHQNKRSRFTNFGVMQFSTNEPLEHGNWTKVMQELYKTMLEKKGAIEKGMTQQNTFLVVHEFEPIQNLT